MGSSASKKLSSRPRSTQASPMVVVPLSRVCCCPSSSDFVALSKKWVLGSTKPGRKALPPRSMSWASGPLKAKIYSLLPIASISSPRIARASARGRSDSIVTTWPLKKMISATEPGIGVVAGLWIRVGVGDKIGVAVGMRMRVGVGTGGLVAVRVGRGGV